jgi:hypothetical protein
MQNLSPGYVLISVRHTESEQERTNKDHQNAGITGPKQRRYTIERLKMIVSYKPPGKYLNDASANKDGSHQGGDCGLRHVLMSSSPFGFR